ncbi:hypothetical protein [Rhizobium rhizogenes]|uniref:hypothetical protein n=1 Tax=Rhizobium rhizogenes TaxID=359 RepID=UPI00226E943C|nr:hypothetical protein [Rhizobium rhizogenes]
MKMRGLIAALISGAVLAVSRDTGHLGFLVLLGPIPLFVHVLGERRALNTFALAYLVGLMAEAGPLYFYGGVIPMIYWIIALQALFFALSVLFMWALYPRSPTVAVFAYAAMTGAIELLYSYISPNGSFGALGYALVDVLPLLQVASLAGVSSLSFLAAIIPAGIATQIRRPTDYFAASAWILPVLAALLFGFWRLAQPDGETIRIALLSNDEFAGVASDRPDRNDAIVADFRQNIEQAASKRPAYIVTPEKMFLPTPEFAQLSVKLNTKIVAGIDRPLGNGQRSNTAELTGPDLSPLAYDKHYLIPGLEGEYVPGKDLVSVDRIGIAICKDMDFPQFLRTYGSRHIGLLLVPAWDFNADGKLHGKMAIVRGVENGFAIARAASHGLLTLSDSKGRIIAETASTKGQGNLVDAVPLGSGDTFYARNGDAFGWSLVILCGGLLFALLVVRIEPNRDA